ncbi:hypothetical protein JCM10212_003299 [Sporobolomyces blumeae]
MTSYISTSDLESLHLSPAPAAAPSPPASATSSASPHTTPCTSFASPSATTSTAPSSPGPSDPDRKKVSFCPLALLIEVAPDGEGEPALMMGHKRDQGKKQLAVRTYSVETPSLSGATSRAWNSVRNGISASLEPLLNSHAGSSSVVSSSTRRDSSPEREKSRERQWRCPERRGSGEKAGGSRRRSSSTTSFDYDDDQDDVELLNEASTSTSSRLRIKIPTVRRRCSRPCLLTKSSKPILRTCSPSSSTISQSLPLPISTSELAASPPKYTPTLSTSPQDRPPVVPAHPSAGLLVRVADCCRNCRRATEYGLSARGDDYVERWSQGAQRIKEEQEKERLQKAEWERDDRDREAKREISEREKAVRRGNATEEDEEKEVEEALQGSKLGQKAKGVDELQLCKKDRRDSLRSSVDEEEPDRRGETAEGPVGSMPSPSLIVTAEHDCRSSSEGFPGLAADSNDPVKRTTPSPPSDSTSAVPSSSRPSQGTTKSTSTPVQDSLMPPSSPRPGPKRRSSSFAEKVSAMGSSLLGAGMGTSSQGSLFGARIA